MQISAVVYFAKDRLAEPFSHVGFALRATICNICVAKSGSVPLSSSNFKFDSYFLLK